MRKQRKQLIIMLFILILAIVVLVFIFKLPTGDEDDEMQSYQITDLEQDAIDQFSFTNGSGKYNFIRQDNGWICEDNKELNIDASVIDRMIGKVASLASQNRITQVEDIAQYGLDDPMATILISDGTTKCTVYVGNYNEVAGIYYLCLESNMETVYTISSYAVSDFIDKGIDDLTVNEEPTE